MHNSFLSIVFVSGLAVATAAADSVTKQPPHSGGVDPADLMLNTTAEPDLEAEGFVDLFNGKDLSGWSLRGGKMRFEVRDGAIVGTCVPGQPNGFLCTDPTFSNFIFTAMFKWAVKGNSGIMFRAGVREEKGRERVFGYQSEMDVKDRAWTGGIYGEAMGGWRYPLSKPEEHADARAAVQDHHAWNRVTIVARGNELKTWINGVPCASLENDECSEGFFGLQVHSGKQGTILWRDIRLKELQDKGAYVDLFASGDFSAWSGVGGRPIRDGWVIENGVVHRGGKNPGDIVTRDTFKNFDLRFEFKISEGGNSGIKYRSDKSYGPEYQVLDDARHPNGTDPKKCVASLYDILAASPDKPSKPAMQWNTGRIRAVDGHLQHWLNGKLVLDIDQGSKDWETRLAASKYKKTTDFGTHSGRILLQDHNDLVWYRKVLIRSLDP